MSTTSSVAPSFAVLGALPRADQRETRAAARTTKSLAATLRRRSRPTSLDRTTTTTSKTRTSSPVSSTSASSPRVRCLLALSGSAACCRRWPWCSVAGICADRFTWAHRERHAVHRLRLGHAPAAIHLLARPRKTLHLAAQGCGLLSSCPESPVLARFPTTWPMCLPGMHFSLRRVSRNRPHHLVRSVHPFHRFTPRIAPRQLTDVRGFEVSTVGEKDEITIKQVAESIVEAVGFEGEVTVRSAFLFFRYYASEGGEPASGNRSLMSSILGSVLVPAVGQLEGGWSVQEG